MPFAWRLDGVEALDVLPLLGWLWRAPSRFIGSRFAFHAVVALLLFVPHLFGSRDSPEPYKLGLPRIHSGDEPHYLVFVHSLVDDGDLALANNYMNVHRGGEDAGLLFRGSQLNHHTVWYVGDHLVHWFEVFDQEGTWGKDENGHPFPLIRKNIDPKWIPKFERPWNSAGMPILLSPIFLVVKKLGFGSFFEPFACILSGIFVLVGSIFWRILAGSFTSDRRVVNLGVALAFLGTPAWHYGRSFFSEPFLIMLLTGAYAFALARPRYVLAGFLVGMAMYVKPIALLMGVPIGVYLLVRGPFKNVVLFTLPVVGWIVAQLAQNASLYGGAFHTSNKFLAGFIVANGLQIIAHPTRGLVSTTPAIILAVLGWRPLVRHSRTAIPMVAACVVFFLVNADNFAWSGGFAYSERFLVPLMPLFCLGLLPLLKSRFRHGVLVVGALSIFINGLAAIQYWRAFHNHPFLYFIFSTDRLSG